MGDEVSDLNFSIEQKKELWKLSLRFDNSRNQRTRTFTLAVVWKFNAKI